MHLCGNVIEIRNEIMSIFYENCHIYLSTRPQDMCRNCSEGEARPFFLPCDCINRYCGFLGVFF